MSHEKARLRIREVANLKKDDVFQRIKEIGDNFYYHQNNLCYKSYTHKKAQDQARNSSNPSPHTKKKTHTTITQSSSKKGCVICGNITYKKSKKQVLLSEHANSGTFLKAATFFNDDLNSIISNEGKFLPDVSVHNQCIDLTFFAMKTTEQKLI